MAMSADIPPAEKVLRSGVLPELGGTIEQGDLIALITSARPRLCGRDKTRDEVLPWLVLEKYLEKREVPRATGRPAIHYVRTSKKLNRIVFDGKGA
jgi:hypothetical protein